MKSRFVLQKFARQGLKTPHIGPSTRATSRFDDALTGRDKALATSGDVAQRKDCDPDRQTIRRINIRCSPGTSARRCVSTSNISIIVNRARIQLFDNAAETQIVNAGGEIAALRAWKEKLAKENDVVIIFDRRSRVRTSRSWSHSRHAAWNNKVHRAR